MTYGGCVISYGEQTCFEIYWTEKRENDQEDKEGLLRNTVVMTLDTIN